MSFEDEIIIETTNYALVRELISLKISGCSIGEYKTRAATDNQTVKIIIEFLSDAAIAAFGAWLGAYLASHNCTGETTINKREIPQNIYNITIVIEQELERQKKQVPDKEK